MHTYTTECSLPVRLCNKHFVCISQLSMHATYYVNFILPELIVRIIHCEDHTDLFIYLFVVLSVAQSFASNDRMINE